MEYFLCRLNYKNRAVVLATDGTDGGVGALAAGIHPSQKTT